MTNEELISKIKAEIESLKSIEYPCDNSQQATGFFNALDRMTDFLSTLESEKPMQDGLEEEIKSWIPPIKVKVDEDVRGIMKHIREWGELIARHFAQWGAEHLK